MFRGQQEFRLKSVLKSTPETSATSRAEISVQRNDHSLNADVPQLLVRRHWFLLNWAPLHSIVSVSMSHSGCG